MMHRIIAVDCFPVKRHVKGIITPPPAPLNPLVFFPSFPSSRTPVVVRFLWCHVFLVQQCLIPKASSTLIAHTTTCLFLMATNHP